MINYTYQLKDVNLIKLDSELKNIPNFVGVTVSENITIHFNIAPSEENLIEVSNIINSHVNSEDIKLIIKKRIENSILFANDLLVNFATENVLLGITQSGKTKEVADYLTNLLRYGQSGSLYEVVNELDFLISSPPPTELAPFITIERLTSLKNKTLEFLQ